MSELYLGTYENSDRSHTTLQMAQEYGESGEGSFPGNGNLKLTPEQEKIHELEKRHKDAELERDKFKKAIGIYSKIGR